MCEIVYNILITNFTVHRCIIRSNAPSNLQMQPLGCIFVYALNCITFGTAIEPAMGSAAFLNEAINQLAEAYIDRKQAELGETISHESRMDELQKVKMYIADNNVYGIDLNPVAVELAEVSLWLNTIYKGGYVPWFGTQLVNGNSLIGARRQVYHKNQLTATAKGLRWYENAPERIPFVKLDAAGRNTPRSRYQVYHFLTGDPGMCDYTDKVIKSLEPEKIKLMKLWNKNFTKPYTEDEFKSLIELSKLVDELWKKQIKARHELEAATITALDVYGYKDIRSDTGRSIREKDKFLRGTYKSEHAQNAGAYARLKFAMDYWCALWFWPISQADLLPSRAEFIFEMDLILRGTMRITNTQTRIKIIETESDDGVIIQDVDLDQLCDMFPRLALVRKIANDNKFMHWELEFADVFADKGGFNLVIGNPPWVKLTWTEQNVLSDKNPMFAIKKLTAKQTTSHREKALESIETHSLYFSEYESMAGQQNFLNAVVNYADLKGQQTNLYKCFLPQAWQFGSQTGVSAFVHPDGVYDDPKGGILREKLYPKLKFRFHFQNEKKLFQDIKDYITYGLNVYSNTTSDSFDVICNLFDTSTIEECYDNSITGVIPGIKDENNNWNTHGHPGRVVRIGKKELELFANLFDGNNNWKQARTPVIHAQMIIDILFCYLNQNKKVENIPNSYSIIVLDETQSQLNETIVRNVHFPETTLDLIYSGSHIGVANPLFKTSRRICKLNSDFDNIDLLDITSDYMQRCNYQPYNSAADFINKMPIVVSGRKYHEFYKLISRRMLNQSGERTLVSAIAPQNSNCINTLTSIAFEDNNSLLLVSALFFSIPFDSFIKTLGRSDFYYESAKSLPYIESVYSDELRVRSLLLNALSNKYNELLKSIDISDFRNASWSKSDPRLDNKRFSALTSEWTWDTPLRTDYERRQALVEIDVLTAMALGMTLEQLKTIYRIQFPVLQQYEANTWYDANGRIVFTTNRSLVGVGFDRKAWEGNVKGAPAGKVFTREIEDDTLPGGPVKRTIEYVAPFDKCDREQDYETAWKFFEEKYGK